jgi:formylglycine-generating enzyme required for sulfatase activity
MVLVPAGWFTMGSDRGEADETPSRKVWVDGFLIDKYEVTQEQFAKLATRDDPSLFRGHKNPVENLTWPDVVRYCNARSRAEGLELCYDEETGGCDFEASGYRLPTEAEWEYACRAGSDSEYFFGRDARRIEDYAWFKDNSAKKTHPVGTRRPNPWGIHDMCGNVTEWCNDVYGADYYGNGPERNPRGPAYHDLAKCVVRGGAWNTSANACRSARRAGEDPGQVDGCFSRGDIGFRCVRTVPDTDSVARRRSRGQAEIGRHWLWGHGQASCEFRRGRGRRHFRRAAPLCSEGRSPRPGGRGFVQGRSLP